MPTVLIVKGYRFFFYTNDHPPKHIHVEKGGCTAKFGLLPVEIIKSKKFKVSEIAEIRKLVLENLEQFNSKWDEYFDNK